MVARAVAAAARVMAVAGWAATSAMDRAEAMGGDDSTGGGEGEGGCGEGDGGGGLGGGTGGDDGGCTGEGGQL